MFNAFLICLGMERKTFRILFFIKRTRLLKNGEAPVCMRVTVDGQIAEIQVKRSVKPDLWSQAGGCCTGKDRISLELNRYLDVLRVKVYEAQESLERDGKVVTASALKNRFLGTDEDRKSLCGVFGEHNERCRKLIGTDYSEITVRRYDSCLRYLREVMRLRYGKEDIFLREVTGELVHDFEFYLKTEKGCQQNTVIRYMKCFKKVINLALANDWISKNPFAGIRFHEVEVNKEFLTREELEVVMGKVFGVPRLDLVRDVFVFCCFTGLAFADVQQLEPGHLVKDNSGQVWIRKNRQKTGNMCNIPLLGVPARILEKYKGHPVCEAKGVCLPVPYNQKMNSYLTEIADVCGIRKNLTTHTARHTFASVVTLANEVSLENVAKMLGHSSTRMTQHYAKVLDKSILRDMGKVEQCFND